MESMKVPIWVRELLERIHDSDYARVELVVLNASAATTPSFLGKLRARWRQLPSIIIRRVLWGLYNAIDRRRAEYRDAFTPAECGPLLWQVPRIEVTPLSKGFSDYIIEPDLDAIRAYQIDVFLRLGFQTLRGKILTLPQYGVWSHYPGDNLLNRGGPAGFWEVFYRWPETGSILQILTDDLDGGRLICRSVSCTDATSLIRSKSRMYWKTLSFVPRKLEELHRDGPGDFFRRLDELNRHPVLYSNRLFTAPSNWVLLRLLVRTIWEKLRSMARDRLFFDQWILLLRSSHGLSTSMWRFKQVIPPKDRFWADPHLVHRGGKYYVFVEEYIYRRRRGRISCMEVNSDGAWQQPYPVLERDYHLSYPFVFEYGDRFYMLPETSARRTVELYESVDFPGKWELRAILMEGVKAFDSTLLFHGGRWWLFCNVVTAAGASSWDELFLFHADSPFSSSWQPHPMNPIVSDASCARPAGKLFEYGGCLYRPSQNCTTRYGYGFNISEVCVLNEREYSERVVTSAYPNWDRHLLGTHSFNFADGLTVGDALRRRRRWF
jgi:hypothetical protein